MARPKQERACTLCAQPYVAGSYSAHAATHTPLVNGLQGVGHGERWAEVQRLHGMGMGISDIARAVGLSRQRVHQIVHVNPVTGRRYRADRHNAIRRQRGS